jgi:hypothetical protein
LIFSWQFLLDTTDIVIGERAQNSNRPDDHLHAAIQSIREAVGSITASTDLAFSEISKATNSREIYHQCLQGAVGQNYNKLALSLQEVSRLHAENFAHIENQRQRIRLQAKLRAKLAAQEQNIQLDCASIPGSFPLVKRVGECVLNTKPWTSGRCDASFIDHNFMDSDCPYLYRWRQTLTNCVRDMNNAWTCITLSDWRTSLEELKAGSLGCAVKIELLLGNFRKELIIQD